MEFLKTFSLSRVETQGIELVEADIKMGMEEGKRSLIGKVYEDKRANFQGVKSSMMKLWRHKGLIKVFNLTQNTFYFCIC